MTVTHETTPNDTKPKRTRAARRTRGEIIAAQVPTLGIDDFLAVQAAVMAYRTKLAQAVQW